MNVNTNNAEYPLTEAERFAQIQSARRAKEEEDRRSRTTEAERFAQIQREQRERSERETLLKKMRRAAGLD